MQTIIGANGSIGSLLAKELKNFTNQVKLVSRNPKKINEDDILVKADVTNKEAILEAVKGSEVVYLTVGFPYNIKTWRQNWPMAIQNVIEACLKHQAKLVFFDNVYMYNPDYMGNMTEETPMQPISKKGKVRHEIVESIFNAIHNKGLTALIARSADFYGPKSGNSVITELTLKNQQHGKPAYWIADATKIHNATYTPDAAKATAILGNTIEAYNQTWHLPTHPQKITGLQWVELFANELGIKSKHKVLSKSMLKLLGVVVPIMREIHEMAYQNDRDYFFNSDKFCSTFNFTPTLPSEGVKETVKQGLK